MIEANKKFNYALCEERHEKLEESMKSFRVGLAKVNNRFIMFLTLLIANLIGVVSTLVIILLKTYSGN